MITACNSGSDTADSMGFTTLARHRRKMMGQGTWTPNNHEAAYRNYQAGGEFITPNGIRPLLFPIKTVHDGIYFIKEESRMMRVVDKHVTMPLLREFTKFSPLYDKLRVAMEEQGIDEVDLVSARKVGGRQVKNIKGDLSNWQKTELSSRFQGIPQVLPETQTRSIWGSQIRKLIIAGLLDSKLANVKFQVGKDSMSGKELLNLYHEVVDKMVRQSTDQLYKELGYEEFLRSPNNKETQLNFLTRLRRILREEVEERDLAENFLLALNIVERNGQYEFDIPLSFPTFQERFEGIILSLFKNRILRQEMNGASLVQIPELGNVVVEKEGESRPLRFIRDENER